MELNRRQALFLGNATTDVELLPPAGYFLLLDAFTLLFLFKANFLASLKKERKELCILIFRENSREILDCNSLRNQHPWRYKSSDKMVV